MTTNNVNSAYFQSPTFQYPGGQSYGGANQAQIDADIQQLLNDLGISGGQYPGGSQNAGGQFPGSTGQYPGMPANGNPPLRSVKLSTRSGGEVSLLEDPSGNLYDKSGKSVGTIGADGSVSFTADGKKEVNELMTNGRSPFDLIMSGSLVTGEKQSDGTYKFAADQVNIGAGDLNLNGTPNNRVQPLTVEQPVQSPGNYGLAV
ncbi:hypothetical protein [Paraburkholderia phenoliruptrix]|uniref:hypothetical protein n=1 Tax=Paraburkholderia phenoliruptrix TaxID=252970 RepID=UPI001C6E471B|nr:hypothetical protein [Paraburkholderia phenoliruptrix]MBW9106755.1 hypothetical protein [Paraburkholderia phenoliruptrix]MBW9131856.1 hypothetical protein [Paraburkholderia ginsengiterrae]